MSRVTFWRRYERVPVSELRRSNPLRIGAVFLIVLAILVYFGFTKHIPFKHGYRLNGAFETAVNVHPKSPVRIAGVDVGQVTGISREGNVGIVHMEIEGKGLPIHTDATLKIRARIFLEGNFFVELQPGSPSAPTYSSGATVPITHTSDPVQLDQVLDALNSDTRANLQVFLQNYGEALTHKPNEAENAEQAPEVSGLNGAQALNKAYQIGPEALRGSAIVNQAITGTEPHDLSELVAAIGKTTAALDANEQSLSEWVPNFNIFLRNFANQSASLSAFVARLPSALRSASRFFLTADRTLPSIRSFTEPFATGTEQTGATIEAGLPWIEQVEASLAPSELGGVATALQHSLPSLSKLISEQPAFFHQNDLFSQCLSKVFFPAGNAKLQDGASTGGVEVYKEFWYALTGLAGLSQSFDGNGAIAHFLIGNSGQTVRSRPTSTLGTNLQGLRLLAHSPLPPLGTRPAYPREEPPYKPLVQCSKQALPEFNGPLAQGPADGS
jgi:phospholipid/cholesterol/gamma-HCH transport system substrate-binding protein